MATKTEIITLPHKNLRKTSIPVSKIDEEALCLCERMKKATLDWESERDHEVGVALAAIQINELKRVIILRDDIEDKNNTSFTCYFNPEIVSADGELVTDYEGCLSVKDIYGLVPRYESVTVKALNEKGKKITFTSHGFSARVLQHEIDHTNGILFIDHIKEESGSFFKLNYDGQLEPIPYEKISSSSILW